MQFLSEVYIDGVQFELEELDKILISASAVIPVFGFKEWHYTNLSSILLYPDNFNEDMQFSSKDNSRNIGGIVGNGRFEKQMILSKKHCITVLKTQPIKAILAYTNSCISLISWMTVQMAFQSDY